MLTFYVAGVAIVAVAAAIGALVSGAVLAILLGGGTAGRSLRDGGGCPLSP